MEEYTMQVIAHIENDFTGKFGIPRQSSLIEDIPSRIVFEKEFRDPNAVRGLEAYSHLWLLWGFSENYGKAWSPTVKPPRLGGNKRMGVFATRSPFRPNPIGLSSVRLQAIEQTAKEGTVLIVSGADLMHQTPIFDIKPYLSFTDSHPDARCGFADEVKAHRLEVIFPDEWRRLLPTALFAPVCEILAQDPRPAYQNDANRRYGIEYGGYDIRFHVRNQALTVCEVIRLSDTQSAPHPSC